MSSIAEVREALDITNSTWSKYINEGIIQKQKGSNYDANVVAQQIIRHKTTQLSKAKGEKTKFLSKIKQLENKILLGGAKKIKTKVGDNGEEGIFEKDLDTKTKELALEINREKLIKIKHENSVRRKEVMPVNNVFEFVTTIASEFSAFLDPIVGQIKQQVPDMSARSHDELAKIFARGRNNLARHIEGKTTHELIHLFDSEASLTSTESSEDS